MYHDNTFAENLPVKPPLLPFKSTKGPISRIAPTMAVQPGPPYSRLPRVRRLWPNLLHSQVELERISQSHRRNKVVRVRENVGHRVNEHTITHCPAKWTRLLSRPLQPWHGETSAKRNICLSLFFVRIIHTVSS